MSRTPDGTYNLPPGNPVADGELIRAEWANTTTLDMASELSRSVDRLGRGGMEAQFLNADGLAGAPGISFVDEPASGFYRNAAGDVRFSIDSGDVCRFQNISGLSVNFSVWDGLAFSFPLNGLGSENPDFVDVTINTSLTLSPGGGFNEVGGDLDAPSISADDLGIAYGFINANGSVNQLQSVGIDSAVKDGFSTYVVTFDKDISRTSVILTAWGTGSWAAGTTANVLSFPDSNQVRVDCSGPSGNPEGFSIFAGIEV